MRPRHLVLLFALGGASLAASSPAAAKPAATTGKATRSSNAPSTPSAPSAPTSAATKTKPGKRKLAAKAGKKREPPPCYAQPVRFTRQREQRIEESTISLTYCDGRPVPGALDTLSMLARPREVDAAPTSAEREAYAKRPLDRGPRSQRRQPSYLSASVMKLHPDLLLRLQAIAQHFPGKTIDIVSGHRPTARSTSRHHHGRALDLRVEGVTRERLRDFARTLEQTGVGYYPNSVFVHVDVRDDKGYWVDRSGPGEPPDYGPWPPRPSDPDDARERILRDAYGQLAELADFDLWDDSHRQLPPAPSARTAMTTPSAPPAKAAEGPVRAAAATTLARTASPRGVQSAAPESQAAIVPRRSGPSPRLRIREEPARPMSSDEVARIRADALKALAKLR
jgi:Bacterial protein of unknown function (DUF882)